MKILITGNMGYVGSELLKVLRREIAGAYLVGFDSGFFAHCLTTEARSPEMNLDCQRFGDIRSLPDDLLKGMDAVIHLAAVSNDPIGNKFEDVTEDINFKASIDLARRAAEQGVGRFVFASSCSMYGFAGDEARKESDELNPLTAYARSKAATERALEVLCTDSATCMTSLRFSTACGMSDRLRLDLVLNDFVASAISTGNITVLSDGTPWRPLIDVKDMARAILWALTRDSERTGRYVAVNVGSSVQNYQVRDLADAVASALPGTTVSINTAAPPDKRSYRVDFSLYEELAPDHQPQVMLEQSIRELVSGMKALDFNDENFRSSGLMRLNTLEEHISEHRLTRELYWR
ncbi:NAD-dependent epimerase/dehydratase family protein [Stutzerimonas nitrititolerans]|uniref:NAD-dependent epimerase/dehydratase family protein n=1 Tax=Stutzerimonas nitrititolerans TaxID=2482751 RepID=UPI001BDBB7F5|nr:SDR family oxidoreductase [Stutzerimonas nitrititolerans]MBT1120891.1 SDR family oxidoreductase [Stutzerimonas nitrititolerans]